MPTFKYNNVVFIHVPKTGGTTIINMVNKPEVFIQKYYNKTNVNDHILMLHAPSYLVKQYEQFDTMIGFVRNPYTRFVALFCMSKFLKLHDFPISEEGLKDFCTNFKNLEKLQNMTIFKPMTFFLYDENKCIVDNIFYFEDYENEIKKVAKIMNINVSYVPKANKNFFIKNSEYIKWYNKCPFLYDFVNEIYKDDFEVFNYKMIKN